MSRTTTNRELRGHAERAALMLMFVIAGGTIGYHQIEGWPLFDSLYMTITTLATVGYGEVHPLGETGRAFTIALILLGVGNLAYAFAGTSHFFAAGGLQAYRRRAKMDRMLAALQGHTIVCGCGRLGTAILHELTAQGAPVVAIERSDEVVRRLADGPLAKTVPYVQGDAQADDVLVAAGIHRAHALVAALNDDASNVFVTLSARVLNPALVIYGKADDPATLTKLERAGANHTFSPSFVAGHRIANQIIRPAITELIGIATGKSALELAIEEVVVRRFGLPAGARMSQTPLWGKTDLLVLAVKTHDGAVVFPPRPEQVLHPDDRIVVMGSPIRLADALAPG
jgi:voltage-gated potassium channel